MIDIVEPIQSEKVKYIANSKSMLRKIKALMLLKYDKVGELFSLTTEEYDEFTKKVFSPFKLLKLGTMYVASYIEECKDPELSELYNNGVEYILGKFSLEVDQGKLYNKLIDVTLLNAINEKSLDSKVRAIKVLSKEVNKPKQVNIIEEISKLLEGKDL